MKILQINVVCGVKSTGRITTDIAALAEERGYDCKIGYGREGVPAPLQKYAVKIGTPLSNKYHAVVSRALALGGFASKAATKKFIKWVEEYDPDVIHMHNIHGAYIHVGVLFDYLKRSGKKVVWTLHDCWSFTGQCTHFSYDGCDRWKSGCEGCRYKRSYQTVWTNKAKRNFAWKKEIFSGVENLTITTPSNWLAGLIKQSFLKDYPVEVIHNGVDLTRFKPVPSDVKSRHGLDGKKIILGAATAWGERKGLQDFYKLADLLGKEYKIVLIGLTEKQIETAPNSILALPATDGVEELCTWYTAADVFVNCTYEDTYPMVNLEAQACGTPVLTYATGGSVESVFAENVIPQGDVVALAERIKAGVENRLLPSDRLDKQVFYRQYLSLYEKKD
ncbi:MAG: glycosyltransferase [Clostridia bacterium]|nr:glycosyltransferase [Clostridia bacterium]